MQQVSDMMLNNPWRVRGIMNNMMSSMMSDPELRQQMIDTMMQNPQMMESIIQHQQFMQQLNQ